MSYFKMNTDQQVLANRNRETSAGRRLSKLVLLAKSKGDPVHLDAFAAPFFPTVTLTRVAKLIPELNKERANMMHHLHHGNKPWEPWVSRITDATWDTDAINAKLIQMCDEAEATFKNTPSTTNKKRRAPTPGTDYRSSAPSSKRMRLEPASTPLKQSKKKKKKKKKKKRRTLNYEIGGVPSPN